MLKRRISVTLVTLVAVVFPALAVAAVAADKAPIGAREAKGVHIAALQRPAKDFHKAIKVAKKKLRAAGVDRHVRAREKASDHAPTWVELA